MKRNHRSSSIVLSIALGTVLVLSAVAPGSAEKAAEPRLQQTEGVRYGYNAETGKLSFVGADPNAPIVVNGGGGEGLLGAGPATGGIALIAPYARAFGLQDPTRDLRMSESGQVDARTVTRFQQVYNGIPVFAGEMIVNADNHNRLLSLSGEIAPELSLSTVPGITAELASETALGLVARNYQSTPGDFTATEPELWIYDSRLLEQDGFPPALVWRVEVTSADQAVPVDELVLVDAQTGGIRLHFNQIDTSWAGPAEPSLAAVEPQVNEPTATPTATPTVTPTQVPDGNEPPAEPTVEGPVGAGPVTLYVSATGDDSTPLNNNCQSPLLPCRKISTAYGKANSGDTIKVATGTYAPTDIGDLNSVLLFDRNITLSLLGGWDASFTTQSGMSILEGSGTTPHRRALAVLNGNVTVDHFTIQNSGRLDNDGGGIYNGGTLTLTHSIVRSNSVTSGGNGGGIYNTNTLTIRFSAISNNSLTGSGGKGLGAGILSFGTLIIENATISGNSTNQQGGGIYLASGTLTMTNATISGNSTNQQGGGIYLAGGTPTITNATISGNTALSGGGIYRNFGTITLNNTILAGNTATTTGPDCQGAIATAGYNLIGNTSGCTFAAGGQGDLTVPPPAVLDARLGALDGSPAYHPLLVTSPAIDAGSPSDPGTGGGACAATDQRGTLRPLDGNLDSSAQCDIGAYEFLPPTPGVPASITVSSGDGQVATTYQAFGDLLSALVVDGYGDPVEGAEVTFTAPAGGASGTFSGTGTNTEALPTDALGMVTSSVFTATGLAGPYAVTASVDGVVLPASFLLENQNMPGSPNSIVVSAGDGQVGARGEAFNSALSVLVLDSLGEPAEGASITFVAPASGPSGTFASTGNNEATAVTDSSGIATAPSFTANMTGGIFVVDAAAPGVAPRAQFHLTSFLPVATTLTLQAGSPQFALPNVEYSVNFSVLVQDQQSLPMDGAIVSFAAPASGASGTFSDSSTNLTTAVTDTNGIASAAAFTANGTKGTYHISATVSGVPGTVLFELENRVTRYVALGGSDLNNNDCLTPTAPCASVNRAINMASGGDTILVSADSYFGSGTAPVVNVNKSVTISGGWNASFTSQVGMTVIDGQNNRRGIYVSEVIVTIERFLVVNGHDSSKGGGIYISAGTLTLNNSRVDRSSADSGGGIYVFYGMLTLNGSAISSSSATYGGGIYSYYGTVTLNNVTISGNSATQSGGGIELFTGNARINNTTVAYNSAHEAGGIHNGGSLEVMNTIIARNTGSSSSSANCSGGMVSRGYNLMDSWGCGSIGLITGDQVNVDPQIGPLVGVLGIHPLHAASPAINTGNPATPGSGGYACLAIDQLGSSRLTGSRCDIGAYEFTPSGPAAEILVQGNNAFHTPPLSAFPVPLRALVLDARGVPVSGATVIFAAPPNGPSGTFATSGTNTVEAMSNEDGIATSTVFTANESTGTYAVTATTNGVAAPANFQLTNVAFYVALGGNDSNSCILPTEPCATINAAVGKTIAGDTIRLTAQSFVGNGSIAVVTINKSITLSGGWNSSFTEQNGVSVLDGQGTRRGVMVPSGYTVTIELFRIQNGSSSQSGGGISNAGFLTLNRISVSGNRTTTGPGGGIYNASGATMTINQSQVSDNTTASGGAGGGIFNDADANLIINQSTISGNTALNSTGGGIHNGHFATLIVNQGAIIENNSSATAISSTSGRAGGLYNYGFATINNSTVGGNRADESAGGIYSFGYLYISNATIANNRAEYLVGGLYNEAGGISYAQMHNSILAYNVASRYPDCGGGTVTVGGQNLVSDTTDCVISSTGSVLIDVDPRLDNLVKVPGDPPFYPLFPGSPAIDAGNDPAFCLASDQRGVLRPAGPACDLGSYERTTSGVPARIFVNAGDQQLSAPNLEFMIPLEVLVVDSHSNPLSGVGVTFTAPANGPGATIAGAIMNTAITDQRGVARAELVANDQLGSYGITASISGVPTTLVFSLTNNAPWYVDGASGLDTNTCSTPAAPCRTIQGAMGKPGFQSGSTIMVTAETYETASGEAVVTFARSARLSGGWNAAFTSRTGVSTFDGDGSRRVILVQPGVIVGLDRLLVQNGFSDNTVDRNGGGILNLGSLYVSNSTIAYNTARSYAGGGIYNAGTMILVNTTIGNNTAYVGGGVYVAKGLTRLVNVTIVDNIIGEDGAWEMPGSGVHARGGSTVEMQDSLIARNVGVNGDCSGRIVSRGYNLVGNVYVCQVVATDGDLLGDTAHVIDSGLSILSDHGGVLSFAPMENSPAIDAGSPVAPGSGGSACEARDQRGVPRPVGARCDIGAYEGSVVEGRTWQVSTYTANHGTGLPGIFMCDQEQPDCTGGGDPEADAAQAYALDTFEFYFDHYTRYGPDNAGTMVISTVHYNVDYDNAFWNGSQMVYGDGHGFALADDVVAHELTHGVTDHTSRLFYYYQSGAINESFSDLWGEFVDQTDGAGNDSYEVKWLIGEDIGGVLPSEVSAYLRDMRDPPHFGDPDRMTSANYYKGYGDNGGVHTNSGVNNKVAFLMTDGGTFNGRTISPLGLDKVAAIYYEVQTHLLTSGSDYSDLYYALYQGCLNLVGGGEGITLSDCQQVRSATDAVEMNLQPAANFNPDADLCPSGMSTGPALSLFQEDMESGMEKWKTGGLTQAYGRWSAVEGFAVSGTYALRGDDSIGLSDSYTRLASSVSIPSGSAPFLRFRHAYDFDSYLTTYYDGGILEYSTNGGLTWQDARPLFSAGQNYGGTLNTYPAPYIEYSSSLHGRQAFVGSSHGYVTSRYSLVALAGQTVDFRWRLSTDYDYYYMGWFLDDVQVYICQGVPSIPSLISPANNALATSSTPLLDWGDTSPAFQHYQIQIATDKLFTAPAIDQNNLTTSNFTPASNLDPNTTYYWRVRAFNAVDGTRDWSLVWSFRTAVLPPVLTIPADAEELDYNRPVFDWADVAGATGYTLQISQNDTFTQVVTTANVTPSTYVPVLDLPLNLTLYWRVQTRGVNGPSTWSEVRILQTANPPSIPAMLSPGNGTLTTAYTPKLDWGLVTLPGITTFGHYELQISAVNTFVSTVLVKIDLNALTTHEYTLQPGEALNPNTTYYWRVRSVNSEDEYGQWSPVWSFRTAVLPPTLSAPLVAEELDYNRPVFDWGDVPAATGYTLQIARDPAFTQFVVNASVTPSNYTPLVDLPLDFDLYWRVQSRAVNGPSAWSEPRMMQTANPPSIPAMLLPANGSLTTAYTSKLDWGLVTLPGITTFGHYELQISTVNTFASTVLVKTDLNALTTHEYTLQPGEALNPNTTYYWRVRSVNSEDEYGQWSLVWSFRTAVLPPVLTIPADAEELDYNRPVFDWGDVTGATGYTLQISRNDTFTQVVTTANVTPSTYVPVLDLPLNLTLYWRVQTRGVNGPSTWSEVRILQTANPPSIPAMLSPGNGTLTTAYTPKLDWGLVTLPGITTFGHYELQISAVNTFVSTVLVKIDLNALTTHEYTLQPGEALNPNTTYYWRVRSVNSEDEYGQWSPVWSFRTAVLPPTLSAPLVAEELDYNRPVFDWGDVTGATGYTLQLSRNDTFNQIVTTANITPSTYTPVLDLPLNVDLYWRVQTRGVNGPSTWSEVRMMHTANPPSVPAMVSPATKSLLMAYTPRLDWGPVTVPSGTSFGHHELQISMGSTFGTVLFEKTDLNDQNTHEYTLQPGEELNPNTTYYWRVRSVNSEDEYGQWSPVWSFRTALQVPALATPAADEELVYNRPVFDWGDAPGAAGYTLQISANNVFTQIVTTANVTPSTYTPVLDLPLNLTLYWRVQSRGVNGPSAWSEVRMMHTANPPSVPAMVSPATNSLLMVYTPRLDWGPVTAPAGTVFGHYELQISTSSTFGTAAFEKADLNVLTPHEYTLQPGEELNPNTTYYWRVRSVNTEGEYGQWSAAWLFRTALQVPALATPAADEELVYNRPVFDWADVPGSTGYTLQISANNVFTQVVTTASVTPSTYTPVMDLPLNLTLYWRVQTRGVNGPSAWSEVRTIHTAIPPSIPAMVSPANGSLTTDYTPTLDWGPVTFATPPGFGYYKLQISTVNTFAMTVLDKVDLLAVGVHAYTLSDLEQLNPNTTYYWRVRSVNSDAEYGQWSPAWSFRTALLVPELSTPAPYEDVLSTRPIFDWADVPGATGYTVQIARNDTFTQMVTAANVTPSTYLPLIDLPLNQSLYWRVQTRGTNGPSNWSEVRIVNSANSPWAPVLLSPASNSLLTSFTPRLDWSPAAVPPWASIAHYQLQISTSSSFATLVLDKTDLGNPDVHEYTLQAGEALNPNATYYWRVRAFNWDNEYSQWSAVWSLRAALPPPSLISPADRLWTTNRRLAFDWSDVGGASSYTIQLSSDANFATILVNITVTPSTYTPTANLAIGTLYWRVRANGASGSGVWSVTRSLVEQ